MGDPSVAKRLRLALDMYDTAERMQRQRLKRTNQHATDTEINAEMLAWRRRRPGAAEGDSPGRPSRRFE